MHHRGGQCVPRSKQRHKAVVAYPEKKFFDMKREDVKNKIPSIIDIARAPEAARLGEPTKSP